MRTLDTLNISLKVLKTQSKATPNKTFSKGSETIPIGAVVNSLERLIGWCSNDLDTGDMVQVVPCAKCIHYKRFRKKNVFKATVFRACELDMQRRQPDFYCKDGDRG